MLLAKIVFSINWVGVGMFMYRHGIPCPNVYMSTRPVVIRNVLLRISEGHCIAWCDANVEELVG